MRVYMTNGTLRFLINLTKKHPNIKFYFMREGQNALVYYEGTKKRVFSAGRTYETLEQHGNIEETGFVMMENIPVQSDSKPIIEKLFLELKQNIKEAQGLLALRLLKQRRKNTYIIFTQWDRKSNYDLWEEQRENLSVKKPAYFLNRRFTSAYYLIDKEELEEHGL